MIWFWFGIIVIGGLSGVVGAAIYNWLLLDRFDRDNPRCFCPDCGADLGRFYSNRIRMER